MDSELKEKDYQNDWAKEIKGGNIHIKNAESGLQGYYCLGCDKEMQAVKFKNKNYTSYFRHNASNVDKQSTECVVASKVYRERLAEQILHRLKMLKVPAVYKFPPKGQDGDPNLLQEGKNIRAHIVKSQLSFYEDEEGTIKWGKNPEIDKRFLLIRPDVTFFNENNEPILFVEFVVTHKLPLDKKVKLNRLGIDTVQIIIPKVPEIEIEKSLKSVIKIKWVYNAIEANSNYVFVSERNPEGISSIDDDQRRFFEESFKCRSAQINELIRSIKKCLGTESYRSSEFLFEREISRIKEATERERQELEDLERGYDEEIFSNIADEYKALEQQERELDKKEERFQKYIEELEHRYLTKYDELEREKVNIGELIRKQIDLGNSGGRIERKFAEQEDALERDSELEGKRFENDIRRERKSIEKIRIEDNTLPAKFERLEEEEQRAFERISREIESKQKKSTEEFNGFGRVTEIAGRKLEERYEIRTNQTIEKIDQRDCTGDSELSKRIETILDVRRVSSSYNEKLKTYQGYKAYLELARSGTWKK